MKTTRNFLILAALALAASAGAVFAGQLDVATALTALFHSPDSLLAGAALAWGPLVRDLQGKHAAAVDAMKAITAKAEAEDRGMTDEEAKAFAEAQDKVSSLKTRIETAQATELAEAGVQAQAPAARGEGHVVIKAGTVISTEDNIEKDAQRGFRSLGEFARSVHGAWRANKTGVGRMDARLASLMDGSGPQAAAPTTFGNEASGADGGFLIPPGFSANVFSLSLMEDSLLPFTDQMPIDGNSMLIPKDEATPWGTNGPRAYWQAEAQAGSQTKPNLGVMDLRLKKLLALTPVTDELLGDTSALSAYLPKRMALSVRWKTNEAIMFGSGKGTPLGAFQGSAAVVHAKDSGQAANTLSTNNLLGMFSRLPPGSYSSAIWQINNTVIPALGSLTLGNYPIFLPTARQEGGLQSGIQWTLLGRPVLITQHAKAFSSQGDVILTDLSYYQTITKSEGIQTATSMHLYFDADAMAFRVTFRVDGQPKLAAPISPANGSTTLSPFVQLQAR